MSLQPEVVVALLSLLLSASLAVVYVRDRRHVKYTIESEHVRSLLAWHQKVVEVLVRAKLLARARDSIDHKKDQALLSALIDQGRFYFPNIDKGDGFGKQKPAAYRGYRHVSLHFLGFAYDLLNESPSPETIEDLTLLQRLFTSEVFHIVGPGERLARMASMTDRYFANNEAVEDYIERATGSDAAALMWRLLRRSDPL